MVCLENVKREGRFWAIKRCGVPAHTNELAIVLMGDTARTAFAKYNPDFMPTIDVDDGELTMQGLRWAGITVVAEMTDMPERIKRGPVEKSVLPALDVMSMDTQGEKLDRTSRRCNGSMPCSLQMHSLQ